MYLSSLEFIEYIGSIEPIERRRNILIYILRFIRVIEPLSAVNLI